MSIYSSCAYKRRSAGLVASVAITAMAGSMLTAPPASATLVVETIDPVVEAARTVALMATNAIYGFPKADTVKKIAVMALNALPQLASGANTMEVPFGVYHISYTLTGANGGNGSSMMTGATIGGAFGVTAAPIGLSGNGPLRVKPGEPLWINIGSAGGNSYGLPFGGIGGYNGGGTGGASGPVWATGGGGGGGMTYISQGGVLGSIPGIGSINRVAVAGGGGGGAGDSGNAGLPPYTPKGGLGGAGGPDGLPGLIPGSGGGGGSELSGGTAGINALPGAAPGVAGSSPYMGGGGGLGGTASIGLPMPPIFLPVDGGGGGGGGAGFSGGGGGASGTPSMNPAQITGLPFSGGGGGGSSGCLHTMPCLTSIGTPPLAGPGPLSLVRAPGTVSMLWASVNSLGVREQATQRKYMVGGTFANDTSTIPTKYISRLEDDGDLDTSWGTDPSDGNFENVNVIRQTEDGKTLVGGSFKITKNGIIYNGIVRLLPNGQIDTTFRPRLETRDSSSHSASSSPVNLAGGKVSMIDQPWQVYDIEPLSSGKYAVAGSFDGPAGHDKSAVSDGDFDPILILNSDGKVDSTFTPPTFKRRTHVPNILPGRPGSNDNRLMVPRIYRITPDTAGRLLVGGDFKVSRSGTDYTNLVRLNSDGSVDSSFQAVDWPGISLLSSGTIRAVTPTTGGKYLIGGELPSVYRINADGSMDNTFQHVSLLPNAYLQVPQATVNVIAPSVNGSKYVIGGDFLTLGGQAGMDYLGRINSDGSADTTFNALNLNGPVNDAAELVGGEILVGGAFTAAGSKITNYLLRTRNDGSLDPAFSLPDITP